jgi:vitamin B12 transporter
MRKLGIVTGVAIGALALASPAGAQPDPPPRVDPVVVTATRVETPARELGVAVSVVPGEDLRTYLYPSVDEALRMLPGLDVRRSGSPGRTSSIGIRGATPNQIQVLVDGVRVKSPTTGLADLSDLTPDLIERIEVIRGPQSTLYGADAMGGVVNVITKRGRGPFGASLSVEGGNYDTFVTRGAASGTWKLVDYALGGSHVQTGGQFDNDDARTNSVNGRVGVTLPRDSHASFALRWVKNEVGLPVKFVCCGPLPDEPAINPNAEQQSETLVMSLEARTRPVSWWESRLRLGRFTNHLGFQDPVDPGFEDVDFPQFAQINVERREVEWLNTFTVDRWSTTTAGFEYRHEAGENRGVFEARYDVTAGFLEQQLRILDRLFVTAGARVEHNSVFGTQATGRGSVAYAIAGWGTRLRGSAGSGFRAPTLNDLFFPGFSNAALEAEHSVSWDAGVDQRLWGDRVRLGATWFHNDFRDLISFVPLPVFPFVGAVNVGRARTQGVEFTAEVDLLRTLVLALNYTYTDTEDLETGNPLPRVPAHRINATVTWEPVPRLTLWAQVHSVTRQFESEAAGYNPGYTTANIGGAWRVLERAGWLQALDLTARIANLANADYAEVKGFPALGINALVGVRAAF